MRQWLRRQRDEVKNLSRLVAHHPSILIWPLLTLVLILACGVTVVSLVAASEANSNKARVTSLATDVASSFRQQLTVAYGPILSLVALVHHTPDYATINGTFNAVVAELAQQASAGSIRSLQLAPAGVIRMVYPLQGNQAAIGIDLFASAAERAGAVKTVADRKITLVGPMNFRQGGYGVRVRTPIFIPGSGPNATFGGPDTISPYCGAACYDEEAQAIFWGFATALIDLKLLADASDSRLRVLEEAGLLYELVAPAAVANVSRIAGTPRPPSHDGVEVAIELPNNVWILRVSQEGDWMPGWYGGLLAGVIILAVAVFALMFAVLVSRRQHQLLLEALLPKELIRDLAKHEASSINLGTRIMQADCPADVLLGMMGTLLDGRTPELRDVLFIRTTVQRNLDIYQPLNLRGQIQAANMDDEVARALMNQLGTAPQGDDLQRLYDDIDKDALEDGVGEGDGELCGEGTAALQQQYDLTTVNGALKLLLTPSPAGWGLGGDLDFNDAASDAALPAPGAEVLFAGGPSAAPSVVGVPPVLLNTAPRSRRVSQSLDCPTGFGGHHPPSPLHRSGTPTSTAAGCATPSNNVDSIAHPGYTSLLQAASASMDMQPVELLSNSEVLEPPGCAPGGPQPPSGAPSALSNAPSMAEGMPLQHLAIAGPAGTPAGSDRPGGQPLSHTTSTSRPTIKSPLLSMMPQRKRGMQGAAPSPQVAGGMQMVSGNFLSALNPAGHPSGAQAALHLEERHSSRFGAGGALPSETYSRGPRGTQSGHGMLMNATARRNAMPPPMAVLEEVERLLGNVDQWQFDTWKLAEATQGHPLSALGFYLMQRQGIIARFKLNPITLARLLRHIEAGYPDNPYHSATHAADVLQTLHVLVHGAQLHVHYLDGLGLFAAYFAAIIHDYGHPGLTNDFLIATADPLAVRYNDRSPLENHHAAAAFSVLRRPELDIMAHFSSADKVAFRKQVIEMVIATDMKQHFATLGHFNTVHRLGAFQPGMVHGPTPSYRHRASDGPDASGGSGVGDNAPKPLDDTERLLTLQLALKCADIGHLGEELEVHKRWLANLEEEFFSQGDKEKELGLPISPLFDRAKQGVSKSQVGFYDFVALPLLHAVSSAFIGARPLMKAFLSNYNHWKAVDAASAAGAAGGGPAGGKLPPPPPSSAAPAAQLQRPPSVKQPAQVRPEEAEGRDEQRIPAAVTPHPGTGPAGP